ncbi:MAG: PIG-L family deacetylase [Dehalococcoidia bacterium]|nr:PIG-L family deacetylase [Dehalococcoidia bacterium]
METPGIVLVVFAHPDDAEFGCCGTIAKWCKDGAEVHYLVATYGDKGSQDPDMLPERMAIIREAEQRAAAAVLGVKSVEFMGYPDGEVEPSREMLGKIVRRIRQVKPDVLLTMEPHPRLTHSHRDHRMVGLTAEDACFPYCRDRLHFPEHLREGLEPHKVGAVLFFGGSDEHHEFVDISDVMDTKIAAIKKHASQVGTREIGPQQFERAKEIGKKFGVQYAEAFRKIEFRR